ncbi:hypothetical protein RND81_11G073100 [Saponaria officinalis]|uniref:Reverse transcriptase domain-containing protein n=1 Tax=Saponaria officinalis TaxID=3572 RepID=A0AAW1HJ22_SAPOF
MDEKLGSDHLHLADMAEFGSCLDVSGLTDHPAIGCHFTWNNKQGDGLRWAKLDRVLVNQLWLGSVGAAATFLQAGVSDHSPGLVHILEDRAPSRTNFRYMNCWALSSNLKPRVLENWQCARYGERIYVLFHKLKGLKRHLKENHFSSFSGLSSKVKEAKRELLSCQHQLQASPQDPHLLRQEKQLLAEFSLLKRAEMQDLSQRAKVQEMRISDSSTQFFYSRIAVRKFQNTFRSILDDYGQLCMGLWDVVQGLPPTIHNSWVPLRLSCLFQLICFSRIGFHQLLVMLWFNLSGFLKFLRLLNLLIETKVQGVMHKAANSTLLVLVPKMETLSYVKDFRPIACCTTFYKVVSKIMVNRLKEVLDFNIGPEQAAFVANRDLFDNSMLSHELASKYGRAYLTPRCLFKVDIQKAFDSMGWVFLHSCLLQLGYSG